MGLETDAGRRKDLLLRVRIFMLPLQRNYPDSKYERLGVQCLHEDQRTDDHEAVRCSAPKTITTLHGGVVS